MKKKIYLPQWQIQEILVGVRVGGMFSKNFLDEIASKLAFH